MAETRDQAKYRVDIQNASSWVLRVGVILSVLVMLVGMIVCFIRQDVPVKVMQTTRFDYSPLGIWQHLRIGEGEAIIQVGIYLLVLTPIMRVATSVVLFAVEEKDWRYAIITVCVLLLTLTGLVFLK